MDRIDTLIQMHDEIIRKEEPIIISKLRMINDLYPSCEDSDDKMLFDEIINTFADIVALQKEMINDLRIESETIKSGNPTMTSGGFSHNYTANPTLSMDDYKTDAHIQAAFFYHLTHNVKKPLSTYTINDYCSRIRNLWNSFSNVYKNGELPDDLLVDEERITKENPLMNAYLHIDELVCYIGMLSAASQDSRNIANMKAALSKFIDFISIYKEEADS